jgi:hypothetical protein
MTITARKRRLNSSDLKNARHRAIALKKPEINRNRVVMIYSSLVGFEIVRIKYCQAQTIATISGPVNEVDGEGLQRRFKKAGPVVGVFFLIWPPGWIRIHPKVGLALNRLRIWRVVRGDRRVFPERRKFQFCTKPIWL